MHEVRRCSVSVPMTARTGWKPLPATTRFPSSGPKKLSAKRIMSCHGCAGCAKKSAYGVYFIFKSMEQGPTFRIACRSILPRIPTTGSWYINGAASRTVQINVFAPGQFRMKAGADLKQAGRPTPHANSAFGWFRYPA